MKKLLTSTALMFGALAGVAHGQLVTPGGASGTIQYSVAVCNPNSPFRCAAPDASGNLPITLSGSPTVLTPVTGIATNPTSTLTRPANTTAYGANQLIASNATPGSIVVPNFAIANAAGAAIIPRVRLSTNATTGWGTTLTLNLWTTAPTYTNGDGGTYAVATGGATHVAQFSCVLTQYGDAAQGECQINVNNFAILKLASGTAVYWDLQTTAAVTPISGQTFTVTAEILN